MDIHNLTEIIANQGFPIALSILLIFRILFPAFCGGAERIIRDESRTGKKLNRDKKCNKKGTL
jgi:hypothetical protein